MPPNEGSENGEDGTLSRRDFLLGATLLASGSLLVDVSALGKLARPDTVTEPYAGGKLLRILPFDGEQTVTCGTLLRSGLDGRLYTDLSSLSPDSLVTPTDKFYVRTSCPDLIDYSRPWTIKVAVSGNDIQEVPIEKVESMSKDMGVHLMECSGNLSSGQFGLMSACKWHGVPVMQLLKSMNLTPKDKRILISGFDEHSQPSPGTEIVKSFPGASWIFSLEQLQSTGAFLATKMNDAPLTKDHGFPVRLVVPGWYGCACIKWVNEISFTDQRAEATPQMKEFASRTHQNGVPELACDYKSAVIDQAALPIRVEEWEVNGKKKYNVVGIMWGGHRVTRGLQIRFLSDAEFVPVESYHQTTNATWTLWSHRWTPVVAGLYRIQLKIAEPKIPAKRLDNGYYVRSVEITQV